MRVSLNLASHPYVELGPVYARLRGLILLLALLALPLWLMLREEAAKAARAHARLAAVADRTQALESRRLSFESSMRLPANAAVLTQSQYLNQVFALKAFSWTAVMMDLEQVLPAGVQVLNIDPVISRSGQVTIRLRVSGQHDRAVELLRNLEHSRRFLFPRLAAETAETSQNGRGFQPVSGTPGVNFDVLAEYNPLPEGRGAAGSAHSAKASSARRGKAVRPVHPARSPGAKAGAKTGVKTSPKVGAKTGSGHRRTGKGVAP
jgi:type IV pilus assembly protein PilN